MYHGRRSSANTSRSSSPQQDTIHSRSTSPVTKRYSCRICNKRFTRPSSLTTHTYSHTGEKPFKCSVDGCGRKFSVVSNLRRHSKIHSGNNMPTSSSSSSTAYSSYSP
ncbi:hypothetical protein BD408DRAFT_334222 [Parasitella parasitica]|nr:hypothetical protein BD408DRAFT_334222 [Parasitella parasitica]